MRLLPASRACFVFIMPSSLTIPGMGCQLQSVRFFRLDSKTKKDRGSFMMRSKTVALIFLVLFGFPSPVLAQEGPEAVYQTWVEASRTGDIDRLLSISSAAKIKEYHNEVNTPEKREETKKLMKLLAPITYQVKKTEISKDGRKAVLLLDATARDFFSLGDPKAKPQHENVEVRLVKEEDKWKVDQHCMGPGGCGEKEDRAERASFGKKI